MESVDEYMQENSMIRVSMENLLQTKDSSSPKIVVVQGVPGIGKSTFAWTFCRRWAKGKIYQQFDLVVLLRMRDIRVREATKLTDLFFYENRKFLEAIADDIVYRDGRGVILLMEGIDELPVSCLADDTVLSNLLQGLSLPEVTILATTRPWAVQMLKEMCGQQVSCQVEILGFAKEDIVRFVSCAFAETKKAEFLEYLHSHPQLESIMHIPMNAAFVVEIYKQVRHSQQTVPYTLTQLYTALVNGLVLRYIKSNAVFRELKLVDLENLPEPIKTHFEQLCLLAFMSFTKFNVQVTFTDSEAALYGCLDSLGLMQSSADLSINTGTTVTHSFLHFTLQEFLAAYHLSQQPARVQELFLKTHKNDYQSHMLFKFLVGLNSDALQYLSEPNISQISTVQLHWLFESQSPVEIRKYLGNGAVEYKSSDSISAFDLYALTYCLCYSHCKWKLKRVDLANLSSIYSKSDDCTGEIHRLSILGVTSSTLQLFFSLPRKLFSKLKVLNIFSACDIDAAIAEKLSSSFFKNSLTFFGCGCPRISASLSTVCSLYPLLTGVGFAETNITSSDMLQLCQYITSPSCSSGFELLLSGNIFSEDGLQLLFSAVACCKYVNTLTLDDNLLSLPNMEMLSVALSVNSALVDLSMCGCSIDGEGAELLASGLEENRTLKKLYLTDNNINTNGAAAFALMLGVNTTLKKLDLCKNKLLGIDGAIKLINALEQNKKLKKLILSHECEPIEYGSILMEDIRRENRVFFQ